MILKRRIVLSPDGQAFKFDMVLYKSLRDYVQGINGVVVGSTRSYEKAEKLELLFNDLKMED